ncbi:hypothetical protein M5689_006949 [Euphorbia peplus]|nr:hypothetical protein M5689_006949 [Euphorbia peplus]
MFWADRIHLAYELKYADLKLERLDVEMPFARMAAKWDALSSEERKLAMEADFKDGYLEDKVPSSTFPQEPESTQGDKPAQPLVDLE